MGNKASIMKVDKNLNREFLTFTEVDESKQIPSKSVLPYFL